MAHYSQLPSYSTDDIKAPLLSEQAIALPMDEHVQENHQVCSRGLFGRIRARCAARCAAKYGPPCENVRCQKKARRRRIFRFVIFGLFSLFLLTHLFKGAYVRPPNRSPFLFIF